MTTINLSNLDAATLDRLRVDLLVPQPQQELLVSRGTYRKMVAEMAEQRPTLVDNPLRSGALPASYMGLVVRVGDVPKRQVFDWSGCRSPARAKRRHARGIPQRVKITEEDTAWLVERDKVLKAISVDMEQALLKAAMGV